MRLHSHVGVCCDYLQVGKKWFNMRLCPEDISDSLSGFGHNGVSPVGLATPLPIILSHRITQLQPDFFFMGASAC